MQLESLDLSYTLPDKNNYTLTAARRSEGNRFANAKSLLRDAWGTKKYRALLTHPSPCHELMTIPICQLYSGFLKRRLRHEMQSGVHP